MAKSMATAIEQYLAELPADRREEVDRIRKVVLDNLPSGYEEMMQYGMIGYAVPLERYPNTYNGQALEYAALTARKRYFSLYLMNVYGDPDSETWFTERHLASGKKLDMGKSCAHFKRADDLPLDLIADTIARTPVEAFIANYEAVRANHETERAGRERR
jgi:hypothetical protein